MSFAHHNLAMVGGADKLCCYLADGRLTIYVEVITSKIPLPLSGSGLLTKTYSNLFYGADYDAFDFGTSSGAYGYAPSRCSCWGYTRSISM